MKKSIIVYTLLLLFSLGASAQLEKFKAIFIYKFAQNFEWPSNKNSNEYIIGVMGNSSLYDELSRLTSGRSVNGKQISVRKFTIGDDLSDLCLLYISGDEKEAVGNLNQSAKENSVVIIGDSPGMAKKGAPLNFLSSGSSLKFEMNETSLIGCGVKASGSIKSLAVLVN